MLPDQTEETIARYQNLAFGIARKYRNKGVDWDDLKQESLIGLLKAVEKYEPDKGTSFATYASYWIRKQVLGAIESNGEKLQQIDSDLGNATAPQKNPCPNEIVLPDSMPELEKKILTLSFVQQKSLKEMARELNISVERVNQTKRKALRRLRLNPDFHPQRDA